MALLIVADRQPNDTHCRNNVDEMALTQMSGESRLQLCDKKKLGIVLWKLRWVAAAMFLCFVVTMFCPVFTARILSSHPSQATPTLFQPAAFIPFAFMLWNAGNLIGSISTIYSPSRFQNPALLFVASVLRIGLLSLYLLCNRFGESRRYPLANDLFYLLIVQLPLGTTNGWLSTACIMGCGSLVEDSEAETATSLMGLTLVVGLTCGSVLSFITAGSL